MDFRLFKDRNFSLLMAGKAVSLTGSNLLQFALSLYVLAITGSATVFASVLSITIFPRLLLSPIAGVFGDWFDRKKAIVILDLISGSIMGIFFLLYLLNDGLTLPLIYILVMALETTEIFFTSAMSAVIPSIVPEDQLFQANSIKSMVSNISSMVAPLIAAFLYRLFGLQIVLLCTSIAFILSAISELFIVVPTFHKRPKEINFKAFKGDLMEGLKIIKSSKTIMSIIGLGTILNFCISPLFSVGTVFVIREVLQGTEVQYGFYATIVSVSMLLTPPFLGGLSKKYPVGRLMTLSFIGVSGLILALALIPAQPFLAMFGSNVIPFGAFTVITFFICAIISLCSISINTLFTTLVPKEFMGRAGTMMNLGLTVSIPLGQMLFGVIFDTLPPSLGIAMAGIIIFVAVYRTRTSFAQIGIQKPQGEATF